MFVVSVSITSSLNSKSSSIEDHNTKLVAFSLIHHSLNDGTHPTIFSPQRRQAISIFSSQTLLPSSSLGRPHILKLETQLFTKSGMKKSEFNLVDLYMFPFHEHIWMAPFIEMWIDVIFTICVMSAQLLPWLHMVDIRLFGCAGWVGIASSRKRLEGSHETTYRSTMAGMWRVGSKAKAATKAEWLIGWNGFHQGAAPSIGHGMSPKIVSSGSPLAMSHEQRPP